MDDVTSLTTRYGVPHAVPAAADATWGADLYVDEATGAYALQGAAAEGVARERPGDCGRCAVRALGDRVGHLLWADPQVRAEIGAVERDAGPVTVYDHAGTTLVARRTTGALYVQAWTVPAWEVDETYTDADGNVHHVTGVAARDGAIPGLGIVDP